MLMILLFAACGPTAQSGGGSRDVAHVTALTVSPATVTVASGPAAAGTQQFKAIATYDDGTSGPLDLVSWELSNDSAGEIDTAGLFTAATTNGSRTTVTATHNGISASADLTVVYDETITEGDGTPGAETFDGTPAATIDWLYPQDGVALPRNVPSLTFMWDEVPGATAYRLSFTTPTTAVTVVTPDHRWTAEAERWAAIAATNAGGQVAIEVRAVSGAVLYATPTLTVNVKRLDAQGSIYYWSTTDRGIVKVPIAAEEGELFYAPETGAPNCVACHVVRGDRMGVIYNADGADFSVGITDISGGQPTELVETPRAGMFNTMNPDGTRMISTAAGGVLNLWDATDGTFLGPIDTHGVKLTQPDWSQDGTMLAAIASNDLSCDNCFNDGKLVIATIDDDGHLGPLTTLYEPPPPSAAGHPNVFYPAISPDGDWVAFDQGDSSSYNNPGAEVYVVSTSGNGEPIALANANLGENLTNSWPHWGPLPDDDIFWLTFSSHRPYGDLVTDERPQIWVAAFDPALAENGEDPSSPAFWLPNQDMETSNHTTFWGP